MQRLDDKSYNELSLYDKAYNKRSLQTTLFSQLKAKNNRSNGVKWPYLQLCSAIIA